MGRLWRLRMPFRDRFQQEEKNEGQRSIFCFIQYVRQLGHLLGITMPWINWEHYSNEVMLVENQLTQLWRHTIIPVPRWEVKQETLYISVPWAKHYEAQEKLPSLSNNEVSYYYELSFINVYYLNTNYENSGYTFLPRLPREGSISAIWLRRRRDIVSDRVGTTSDCRQSGGSKQWPWSGQRQLVLAWLEQSNVGNDKK
jgi:hypothetical protein